MILSFPATDEGTGKLICQYTISLKINLAHFQIAMNFFASSGKAFWWLLSAEWSDTMKISGFLMLVWCFLWDNRENRRKIKDRKKKKPKFQFFFVTFSLSFEHFFASFFSATNLIRWDSINWIIALTRCGHGSWF